MVKPRLLYLALIIVIVQLTDGEEQWQGRYFPELKDAHHGIKMGVPHKSCDDGETNIDKDYDGSMLEYACFENRQDYRPNPHTSPMLTKENVPKGYNAIHYCMATRLNYNSSIPTFGPHRPLWARYGEYRYIPPQRWLHNLEHGAIIMLYHPCADANEVYFLKQLVKQCLYRHIISPSRHLSKEYPIALVAWGYRLEMSKVYSGLVIDFMRSRTNKGAERTSRNGKYSFGLIEDAQIVSDKYDSRVCPRIV